ncbi:MAG: DUF2530 domain-containing protein [Candidatus Nanopelagicales bacterium]
MSPHPQGIEPVPDDGVRAMTIGTVLWGIAGVVCALSLDQLDERGDRWWIWTCATGFVLGLLGLAFVRRRARVYREHRDRERARRVPA